jgi:hypothetical protein
MNRSPAEVVQAQLEAYNLRDLDAFMALFSDDAQLFELGVPVPSTAGKSAIAERYRRLFDDSPALHSIVITRTTLGRAVVDLERITGRMGVLEAVDVIAIYEVESGLIVRAHFVRP